VPPPVPSLGGASDVRASGDSGEGGGTGAGASAFVGTYVPAADISNVSEWPSGSKGIAAGQTPEEIRTCWQVPEEILGSSDRQTCADTCMMSHNKGVCCEPPIN